MKHLDKNSIKHFGVCFAGALFSTEFSVGAGVGKEMGDYTNYGHFCIIDLLVDIAGAALGTAARLLLIRAIYGHWKYSWY